MHTVLLFDIDGTLLLTGGAGRRAMVGAFESLHRSPSVFEKFSFGGMTDRAIARHGLTQAQVDASDDAIEQLLERYLELLQHELGRTTDYRVLPGVMKLLARLHEVPDVAVGLGTGNVRRGAYAKLAHGAIDASFGFGGFGCDAEDRTALLRAGAQRGAALLGATMEECRVVVIGDTPKDVAAAKGIGAPCLGVTTGGFGAADLATCGARRVFNTLDDDGVFEALFDDY